MRVERFILSALMFLFGCVTPCNEPADIQVPAAIVEEAQTDESVEVNETAEEVEAYPVEPGEQEAVDLQQAPEPKQSRYASIAYEAWEIDELAKIVFLEAGNQSAAGQQAVAEVVLNRVMSNEFPNSIHAVLHEGESRGVLQFTTVKMLDRAAPSQAQYDAINAALYGEPILPLEVVFFSRGGENNKVFAKIGDHVFCYAYSWRG